LSGCGCKKAGLWPHEQQESCERASDNRQPSGFGGDGVEEPVVGGVDRAVGADFRWRVGFAGGAVEGDALRERAGQEVPAIEPPVFAIGQDGAVGGVDRRLFWRAGWCAACGRRVAADEKGFILLRAFGFRFRRR
jgi:hypothetical protein